MHESAANILAKRKRSVEGSQPTYEQSLDLETMSHSQPDSKSPSGSLAKSPLLRELVESKRVFYLMVKKERRTLKTGTKRRKAITRRIPQERSSQPGGSPTTARRFGCIAFSSKPQTVNTIKPL